MFKRSEAMKTFNAGKLKSAFTWLGVLMAIANLEHRVALADVPKSDAEWNNLAATLIHETELGRPVGSMLDELIPEMKQILKVDSNRTFMKTIWGTSLNGDEHAHAEIVNSAIISELSEQVGVPLPDGDRVFAGIEHTYGYLFSTLETDFGHKRLRWVQGELESGFNLPKGTLGPFPEQGTLFGNVTYFLGSIAFQNDTAVLDQLQKVTADLSEDVLSYTYDHLAPVRIVEEVRLDSSRVVRLRTDLVPFLKKPRNEGSTYLLVYSIEDSANSLPQLITGFPVNDGMVKSLRAEKNFGSAVSITTHYNAYVSGLTGRKVLGIRRYE